MWISICAHGWIGSTFGHERGVFAMINEADEVKETRVENKIKNEGWN
jgi:hypothetical protein